MPALVATFIITHSPSPPHRRDGYSVYWETQVRLGLVLPDRPSNVGRTSVRSSKRAPSVVWRPRLKRTAPIPTFSGTRIAASTGESSTRPAWHAEPVDAAIPSSLSSTSAPTTPTKETLRVLGKRCSIWPFSTTRSPKRSCSAFHKRSRRVWTRVIGARFCARVQAVPRPTASRALSVPARRPCSWPAPWISGSSDASAS
jgi:hypothetical protein